MQQLLECVKPTQDEPGEMQRKKLMVLTHGRRVRGISRA